jgi:ADP-ribose pyrophosphatase YjhB (NUDIX family)
VTYAIADKPVAAVMIVLDKDGRVLTVARPDGAKEQTLPGGMLKEYETPEQAAVRELREETCVVVSGCVDCGTMDSPEDAGVTVHVFRAKGFEGVAGEGEMGCPVKWLSPEDFLAQSGRFKKNVKKLLDSGCFEPAKHPYDGRYPGKMAPGYPWAEPPKGLVVSKQDPRGITQMDLGIADVHVPGANGYVTGYGQPGLPEHVGNLGVQPSKFAWPEQRKYPVHDAASVKSSAARLSQDVKAGKISRSTSLKIQKRIAAAGKSFGVDVEDDIGPQPPVAHPGPMKTRMHIAVDHPDYGHFEIRHMKDGSDQFRQRLTLSDEAAVGDEPTWNQIATRGTFRGHGAGEFTLDDSTFADIIRNYREVDNGEVHFDYEHASEAEPTEGSIPVVGAPAQAWIKDLKVGPAGLFALVKWLEPAKTQIREGKYRFVSPAIRFNAKHPATGKVIGARLTSVALTNSPFLRGLQPLAAKDTGTVAEPRAVAASGKSSMSKLAHSPHETMPLIRQCLGMHEISTPHEVMERCRALREMCMSADAGGMSSGVPVADYCDKLRDMVDVPMGSTIGDVFNAVEAMIQAAIEDHEERMHPDEPPDSAVEGKMSNFSGYRDEDVEDNALMGDLDAAKRNALPESSFAWPEQRKFPIHDAAHVRNAAARLAQAVKSGRISKSKAGEIHKRIAAAGKRFGVEVSELSGQGAEMSGQGADMSGAAASGQGALSDAQPDNKSGVSDGSLEMAGGAAANAGDGQLGDKAKSAEMATAIEYGAKSAEMATAIESDKDKKDAELSGYKDALASNFTIRDGKAVRMTDEEIMSESIAMKEVTKKLTTAEAEVAKLTLQLKDRDSKVETLTAENAKLLKDVAEQQERSIEERVRDAFETHKDSQKLTDKHLAQMKVFCKADRKAFDELYPVFRGVKKVLLNSLTGGGKDVAMTSNAGAEPPPPEGVLPGETPNDTAVRLTLADPNLSMADATVKALKMHSAGR